MLRPEDLLIFQARAAANKGKQEKEKPAAVGQVKPQLQPQPIPAKEAVEQAVQAPVTYQPERVRTRTPTAKKEVMGFHATKGQFCAWHAWRPAYAICNFCHRPFCYEDIEEFNNGYYCLEDIDKVSITHAEGVYTKYTNISFVSAAMLMLAFAVFMLFANAQLAYVVNSARILGTKAFLANLNLSYETLLLEAALTIVSLASAVMLMLQSKRAYGLGTAACIGNIALFSYLFLGSGTLYIAVIAVVSFAGLLSLVYSRVTYVAYEEETPFVNTS